MTNQPSTPAAAPTLALEDRVAALELFTQHLLFVLDANGAIQCDALNRWINTARARMLATGSVPAAQVHALEALQELVQR